MVVGDGWPGGARAALEFPYVPRAELIQVGEAAELLVLSRDEEFITFKVRGRGRERVVHTFLHFPTLPPQVVREVYLPQSGICLVNYPFVEYSTLPHTSPHSLSQVVREVYLPQSGVWLADYPFVDRNAFLDMSLAVERERQRTEAEAQERNAWSQQWTEAEVRGANAWSQQQAEGQEQQWKGQGQPSDSLGGWKAYEPDAS